MLYITRLTFLISVSEIPVNLFEETPETENIMKNLGSLPIHIRHAQQQRPHLLTKPGTNQDSVILSSQTSQNKNSSQVVTSVNDSDFSEDNVTVIPHDDQTDLQLVRILSKMTHKEPLKPLSMP